MGTCVFTGGGEEGTQQGCVRGCFAPQFNPLSFNTHFYRKVMPFVILTLKMVLFSRALIRTFHPFSIHLNEVKNDNESLPTLINLATRSQTWNLFRWNCNPPLACHAVRQEKRTS